MRVYLGTQGRGAWRLTFDAPGNLRTARLALRDLNPRTLKRGQTTTVRATLTVNGPSGGPRAKRPAAAAT